MKYCYEMGLLIDKWEDSGLGKLALSVAHGTKQEGNTIHTYIPHSTYPVGISDKNYG